MDLWERKSRCVSWLTLDCFSGETSNMTGVGEQSPSLSQDMPAMMTQVTSHQSQPISPGIQFFI